MSHAAHFLTRLERLAAPEVDLALALYRDPRIVKELISTVCVSSSDRAALALTADPQGPHLIVGGDGGFITCLARGMGLNGTRRIERREVQAALKNKALVSLGDELLQEHPALLTMLSKQAVISREEFSVIAKFQPALEHLVVDQLIKDVEKTFSLRERWEEDRLSLKGLEAYWRAVQKHGHLASLLGMSGRRFDGLDLNTPGIRLTISNTCVPIDPVEPRITRFFKAAFPHFMFV